MLQSNFPVRPSQKPVRDRPIRAIAAIIAGLILIAAGLTLAFRNSGRQNAILPPAPSPSLAPAASVPVPPLARGNAPAKAKPVDAGSGELGQTLEEFQAEYESLSGKPGAQEAFFRQAVGKKVDWVIRVDHVFRTETGVIIVFSSTERPDWAAYPISDARFPTRLEKQLMALSRGDNIKIKGEIVYRGIKTLECSSFEIVR
jgi:hypothetical protein